MGASRTRIGEAGALTVEVIIHLEAVPPLLGIHRMTAQPRAHRRARRIAWLAVVALVVAAFAPNVLALTGAIYTSNFDGSVINANTNYAVKADVYLTGGPCGGGSHLPDGDYYFQVTSPNGVLLSTDAIEEREFSMSGGFIQSAEGHATNPVNCNPPVAGVTVQLIPFADTPNNGNEYKLHVATKASVEDCPLFDETSSTFVFCNGADQKSDNFKVGADPVTPSPVVTPTPTPVVTPTPTPVVTPPRPRSSPRRPRRW